VVLWLRNQGFGWIYRVPTGVYWDTFKESKPPFDIWAMRNGESWCIECKSCTDTFSFQMLKPHQITGLLSVEKSGAKSYVAIEFKEINKSFLVPIKKLVNLMDTVERKSATHQMIEKIGLILNLH
jgi:penicillin-binding protein-related factor A (putative recombinase)